MYNVFMTEEELDAILKLLMRKLNDRFAELERKVDLMEARMKEYGLMVPLEDDFMFVNSELFEEALCMVLEYGFASVGMFVDEFGISAGQALMMVDQLERCGFVKGWESDEPGEINMERFVELRKRIVLRSN